MVNFCAVFSCSNRSDRNCDRSFYRLPSIKANVREETRKLMKERRFVWLNKIRRADIVPSRHTRVCSDHFVSGHPAALQDRQNVDLQPTLNLGYNPSDRGDDSRSSRLSNRREKIRRKESVDALLNLSSEIVEDSAPQEFDSNVSVDAYSQSHITSTYLDAQEEEIKQLKQENETLRARLRNRSLTRDSFEDNNENVLFYTGLPTWTILYSVFTLIKDHIQAASSLDPFEKVLLTLMRLRLGLSGQDLGYRFGVHQSTVTRIFSQTLDVLYCRLAPLIKWPDRNELRKTLPMDFRKHCPNCCVILDCFNIFLERPENRLARAQTYSNYKHHNTVKYLIGITPQGTVCFISDGWGGRTSDQYITENSGMLKNLIPGDVILADRGFDIQESVGLYCATIKIPVLTKGKPQLTGIEVEQTQRIANVRIHVERVIGNI